MIQQIGN